MDPSLANQGRQRGGSRAGAQTKQTPEVISSQLSLSLSGGEGGVGRGGEGRGEEGRASNWLRRECTLGPTLDPRQPRGSRDGPGTHSSRRRKEITRQIGFSGDVFLGVGRLLSLLLLLLPLPLPLPLMMMYRVVKQREIRNLPSHSRGTAVGSLLAAALGLLAGDLGGEVTIFNWLLLLFFF